MSQLKCVTKKDVVKASNKLSKCDKNIFDGHHLSKGKYDINYVINLLKIIESKCGLFNGGDLSFSLKQSCIALRAMLEVERDTVTSPDPILHLKCMDCKNTDLVRKSISRDWKCPHCPRQNSSI